LGKKKKGEVLLRDPCPRATKCHIGTEGIDLKKEGKAKKLPRHQKKREQGEKTRQLQIKN